VIVSSLPGLLAAVLLACVVAGQLVLLLYVRRRLRAMTQENRRLARQVRRASSPPAKPAQDFRRAKKDLLAQVEALLDLYVVVAPSAPMPTTQGWAAAPATMRAVVRTALERSASLVLECGSGSSSVWLGHVVQRHGGRVVALEHRADYVERTRGLVRTHGLEGVVDVRLAPLTPVTVAGESYSWYDPSAWADLDGVDMVFVDGPPGSTGPQARFPAVPLLRDRCVDGAVFLLDDTTRADEREVRRRWQEEYGARPIADEVAGSGCVTVELARQGAGTPVGAEG
jgi:predicted O-methyltransferase YrrM